MVPDPPAESVRAGGPLPKAADLQALDPWAFLLNYLHSSLLLLVLIQL